MRVVTLTLAALALATPLAPKCPPRLIFRGLRLIASLTLRKRSAGRNSVFLCLEPQ